jgi:hypothetical protein
MIKIKKASRYGSVNYNTCEYVFTAPSKIQTKRMSVLESVITVSIGYIISMCLYMVVLPMFGYNSTWTQSFFITLVFFSVSIITVLTLRRIFNWFSVWKLIIVHD